MDDEEQDQERAEKRAKELTALLEHIKNWSVEHAVSDVDVMTLLAFATGTAVGVLSTQNVPLVMAYDTISKNIAAGLKAAEMANP